MVSEEELDDDLEKNEKAMISAMSGVKLIDKRSSQEVADLLSLEETLHKIPKANGMQWYEGELRRDNNGVSRRTLYFEVVGRRRRSKPKSI